MNNMSIDELEGEYFHFFNTDYLLLVIIILLEKYHHGQRDGFGVSSAFFLGDFIKGGISSLEDVVNEINDTSDYSSPNEYILSHIIRAEELNMLKVRQIGVQDLISIQYKVMNCAVKNDPRFPIEPDYYCMIIDELMEFKNLEKERNEKMVENGTFTSEEFRGPIFFSGEYTKHIRMLLDIAPENIYIRVTFIDEGIKRVEKELKQYISNFSEDLFKDRKPEYSETTRLYFSKQIESFYAYITNLSLVNSTINIPFSALESKDFEIVKILKYLELNKIITINKRGSGAEVAEVPCAVDLGDHERVAVSAAVDGRRAAEGDASLLEHLVRAGDRRAQASLIEDGGLDRVLDLGDVQDHQGFRVLVAHLPTAVDLGDGHRVGAYGQARRACEHVTRGLRDLRRAGNGRVQATLLQDGRGDRSLDLFAVQYRVLDPHADTQAAASRTVTALASPATGGRDRGRITSAHHRDVQKRFCGRRFGERDQDRFGADGLDGVVRAGFRFGGFFAFAGLHGDLDESRFEVVFDRPFFLDAVADDRGRDLARRRGDTNRHRPFGGLGRLGARPCEPRDGHGFFLDLGFGYGFFRELRFGDRFFGEIGRDDGFGADRTGFALFAFGAFFALFAFFAFFAFGAGGARCAFFASRAFAPSLPSLPSVCLLCLPGQSCPSRLFRQSRL